MRILLGSWKEPGQDVWSWWPWQDRLLVGCQDHLSFHHLQLASARWSPQALLHWFCSDFVQLPEPSPTMQGPSVSVNKQQFHRYLLRMCCVLGPMQVLSYGQLYPIIFISPWISYLANEETDPERIQDTFRATLTGSSKAEPWILTSDAGFSLLHHFSLSPDSSNCKCKSPPQHTSSHFQIINTTHK